MDNGERQASLKFVRRAVAVDLMANTLRDIAISPAAQGWSVDGIACTASTRQGILFECTTHNEVIAARYIHLRDGDEPVGRIHFCRVLLDGSIGDSLLAITIRANGDISCPDGEGWDLWPQNHPDSDEVRNHLMYQILAAVQRTLPAL